MKKTNIYIYREEINVRKEMKQGRGKVKLNQHLPLFTHPSIWAAASRNGLFTRQFPNFAFRPYTSYFKYLSANFLLPH